jgi:hypothetical protein
MRPTIQLGQVLKHGNNWVLRFREDVGGKRVRRTEPLAPYSDFPERPTAETLRRVRDRYKERIAMLLAPVNKTAALAVNTATLNEFIEHSYFPRLDQRQAIPAGNELHLEATTVEGYKNVYAVHVKNHAIGATKLRAVTTKEAQKFLESLDQSLSHNTHMRVKNFLSGVFTHAIQEGAYTQSNPMDETKAGGRTKGGQILPGCLRVRKSAAPRLPRRTNTPTRWKKLPICSKSCLSLPAPCAPWRRSPA